MNRTKLIRSAFFMWGIAISLLFTLSTALAVCPGQGDCCEANGTPGCEDEECCEIVCSEDPFCCDVISDEICADTAHKLCDICIIPGDLNNDGVVDGADLLILLSHWGDCRNPDDCPADLNHDGTVDGKDLLILLNNWD